MKKVIKLKESDIVRMVKLVLEQDGDDDGFMSIQDAVNYMENKLNDEILPKLQNQLLNEYSIRVKQNAPEDFSVIIRGSKDNRPEEYEIKLKREPKVKNFLDKNPRFEDEILKGLLIATLKTDLQNGGQFKLTFFGIKRGKLEGAVSAGVEYPLADFFSRNSLPMVVTKEIGANLESGNMQLILSKFYFSGPGVSDYVRTTGSTTPSTGTTTSDTHIKLNFTLVDAFKFDETNFVDESKAMEQIDVFVNKVKGGVQKYGQELSQHIMSAEPSIVGYASIDADPNEKITGKFGPCKSKSTRGEYNKCLSEYRAKKISEIINQKLDGTGVSLKFFGAGETTKFGPGWSKEKPTTTQQTSPNRRFTLTPIPPFTKVIKGK